MARKMFYGRCIFISDHRGPQLDFAAETLKRTESVRICYAKFQPFGVSQTIDTFRYNCLSLRSNNLDHLGNYFVEFNPVETADLVQNDSCIGRKDSIRPDVA